MNRTRIQIARPDIIRFFDDLPSQVHRQKDIAQHLTEQRAYWRLTQGLTVQAFVQFLIDAGKLSKIIFPFPKPYKRETRYVWGDVNLYQVVLTLKPNCYFSHYTAAQFHGLTEQLPKTIYLNDEQYQASVSSGTLSQQSITSAFQRKPRVTSNIAESGSFRVCILNGKNTGRLGVVEEDVTGETGTSLGVLRFTNLERTLIDMAVRPIYAGGVFEVRKAYGLAKDKLSVNRLTAMLQKLHYIYPYHQAIGFYLERVGYQPSQLDLLRQFPMEFDFYLAHGLTDTDFIKEWRLYVPKGF